MRERTVRHLDTDEAALRAGAAALVGAISLLLTALGPLGALGRLPNGVRLWTAVTALFVMSCALICLAYLVGRLFTGASLLDRYVRHPDHARLETALRDAHLLAQDQDLAGLQEHADGARRIVASNEPDPEVLRGAAQTLDSEREVIDFASRWEREELWQRFRGWILTVCVIVVAGAVIFSVAANPLPQPLITTPIPVTVILNNVGWAEHEATLCPSGSTSTTRPATTRAATAITSEEGTVTFRAVAIGGRLAEPVVVVSPHENPCHRHARITIRPRHGVVIPLVGPTTPTVTTTQRNLNHGGERP